MCIADSAIHIKEARHVWIWPSLCRASSSSRSPTCIMCLWYACAAHLVISERFEYYLHVGQTSIIRTSLGGRETWPDQQASSSPSSVLLLLLFLLCAPFVFLAGPDPILMQINVSFSKGGILYIEPAGHGRHQQSDLICSRASFYLRSRYIYIGKTKEGTTGNFT